MTWEMKMEKDKVIADAIQTAGDLIAENKIQAAVEKLTQLLSEHEEWADERLRAEVSILNHQIENQKLLDDWSYFRAIRSVYQYCEAKYASNVKESKFDAVSKQEKLPDHDVIWWCWLQGFDQAPDLVKQCHDSLRKLNRPIKIVTEENYSDYISLPPWILEKYADGVIDRTHFSDLIRIELLTTRGGTWIDSTVYCSGTEQVLPLLNSAKVFMFSFVMRDSISKYILFDNWFMHASVESKLLMDAKSLLFSYWREENTLLHYFIFHILFTIACELNPEESKSIPIYSNEPCHILQRELFSAYTKERWNQITGMSDVHKLSYKLDQDRDLKGSFWEFLLETKG